MPKRTNKRTKGKGRKTRAGTNGWPREDGRPQITATDERSTGALWPFPVKSRHSARTGGVLASSQKSPGCCARDSRRPCVPELSEQLTMATDQADRLRRVRAHRACEFASTGPRPVVEHLSGMHVLDRVRLRYSDPGVHVQGARSVDVRSIVKTAQPRGYRL